MSKPRLQNQGYLIAPSGYTFFNFNISQLSYSFILRYSPADINMDSRGFFDVYPDAIEVNSASFTVIPRHGLAAVTSITQKEKDLILHCSCGGKKNTLCEHQTQILLNLLNRPELQIFFNDQLRNEKIKKVALEYGLQDEPNPEQFFNLSFNNKAFEIKPKIKELFPLNKETEQLIKEKLLPAKAVPLPPSHEKKDKTKNIVVFSNHKFYNHLYIDFFEAQISTEGRVKNPLKLLNPTDLIWKTEGNDELKFYSGIAKFQNTIEGEKTEGDIQALKAIAKNPLKVDMFYHNSKASASINASSIVKIKVRSSKIELNILVDQKKQFYEISGQLMLEDRIYDLQKIHIRYDYFVMLDKTLFLIENPEILRVINFFKQNNNVLVFHQSRFEEFRETVLLQLEGKVNIKYSYLMPATPQQLEEYGFDLSLEKKIYISDSQDYIILTPVMSYGTVEIPVLSKKQIYIRDAKGNPFSLERDQVAEDRLLSLLLKQHPDFKDQLHSDSFYLHKNRFLGDDWFLDAFEEWKKQGITILGFNEIKHNKLNPNKPKISVRVSSGVDWFNTTIDIRYGNQKVSLKHLHKSLRNKTKFVELGDGTQGILPTEWINRFAKYFQAGEIVDDTIRTPYINFADVAELYEEEVLTEEAKVQLEFYKKKTKSFEGIKEVAVPAELNADLREYQRQGLNWLNFLDEFNFGGCLADDMGLGKTIQVIAFILHQGTKQSHNTNLVVVPTSLMFNWESEIKKFAPTMKILPIYGANRVKDINTFDQYEVVLTSYGTLPSDISFLKEYRFNYIFLDESQAIKDPDSLRYKTVRLLQSRNKIVLTGTPIENNTFDLYGQLSFACPGLLGSKQYFKDYYSIPIDKFKDGKRAKELQRKINPFILRRTKAQVATELPEKTEMVIRCDMGEEQRSVYDSYAKEFYTYLTSKQEGDIPRDQLHILAGLTKLRQICNSPALLNDQEYYGDSSAKIDVLLEQIESKSEEHKIIVFSQFVSMLDLIKSRLIQRNISFEYLTGQTRNRASKVKEFQDNNEVRVFLISLKAGGTGLNLTAADYVYLVDPWWNPAVENQAIDRIYRIGQKKNVVAVRLISPDTIEEKILSLQASKRDLAGDLIRTDTDIVKSLTKEDLLGLLK